MQTKSEWTVTDQSRYFSANYPGECAITGLPFYAGDSVCRAIVDGKPGIIALNNLPKLDVRTGYNGTWVTAYTRDVSVVAGLLNNTTEIQMVTRTGALSIFRRSTGSGNWSKGSSLRSPGQLLAQASKSYAVKVL